MNRRLTLALAHLLSGWQRWTLEKGKQARLKSSAGKTLSTGFEANSSPWYLLLVCSSVLSVPTNQEKGNIV